MPIAYTQNGKELVANLAPGVTPEQAAKAMNLTPGAWRVISDEEAADLQKPTPEEADVQRIAEIDARLGELDRKSIRSLRAIAQGVDTGTDHAMLSFIVDESAGLREERYGLAQAQCPETEKHAE